MQTYWNRYNRKAVEKHQDVPVEGKSLDDMTKAQLLDEAARRGVDVNSSATKAEILDALS